MPKVGNSVIRCRKVTSSGTLRIVDEFDGDVLGEVPASSLHDDAPLYERPMAQPETLADQEIQLAPPDGIEEDLIDLLMSPQWATSQYDSQLFLNTVVGPGSDAAVLRFEASNIRRRYGERHSAYYRR